MRPGREAIRQELAQIGKRHAQELAHLEEKYALNAAIRRRSGDMLVGEAIDPTQVKGSIISVNKKKLEDTIRKNLEKHVREYAEAVEDHKKALIRHFEYQLALAKDGKDTDRMVPFEEPESHKDDYNRVITMLEYCTKDEVYISEQEFKHYVMDDWNWKQSFATSNALYKMAAARR